MMEDKAIIYIQIMIDSLQKKNQVLHTTLEITTHQKMLLEEDNFDIDSFEEDMMKKQIQIQQLEELDKGFERVYNRLKEDLSKNRQQYQASILEIQALIGEVTEYSVKLQAMEEQNKIKLQTYLANQRQQIQNVKISNQTAATYYKNMASQHQGQSYFLDKKK